MQKLKIQTDEVFKKTMRFDQMLIDVIPTPIFYKDAWGVYLGGNKAFERYLGLPPERFIGRTVYDISPLDLAEKYEKADRELLNNPGVQTYEASVVGADGTRHDVVFNKATFTDAEGNVAGLMGVILDITEHKRIEEELAWKTAFLEAQVEATIDGILVVDGNNKTILVNQHFLDICKVPQHFRDNKDDTFLLQHVTSITMYPEQFIGKVMYLYEHPHETSRDEVEFKDGMVLDRYSSPVLGKDGKYYGRIWIFRDITERKQVEAARHKAHNELEQCVADRTAEVTLSNEELRKEVIERKLAEERYRTLFNEAYDGIALADLETGELLDCNQALCRMVERTKEELIGQVQSILHPQQTIIDMQSLTYRRHTSEDAGLALEDSLLSSKEKLIPVEIRAAHVSIGGQHCLLGIFRDITERKRAEEASVKLEGQFHQAQKMESVGRLAGGVAHDFNNMLGVIMGHAEMAIDKIDTGRPLLADLQEIIHATERSADLTRQLLTFARKQVVSPKVIDLNETMARTLKMLQRLIGEDIRQVWLPGVNLWPVKIDPSQIDQLLANLCVNARDAIAGVGKVTIGTENIRFDDDYCANHADFFPGDYVMLAVSDDGCGMDKETADKIFEPFFTTKAIGKGTGLGLSTVYGIVKQNNGFINVYSEPEQGTTFKIYLPRHRGKTEGIGSEATALPLMCGHETILVVEDDRSLLDLIKYLLEGQGYKVLIAGTPGEATRLAEEFTGEIHLLMTDVILPEMNGRDLAKKILFLKPNLKCLFSSGYTADVIAHHGVLEEGVYFIQKPFSRKDLTTKVRETLDQK